MTELNLNRPKKFYNIVTETENNPFHFQKMEKIRVVVIEDHELSLLGIRTSIKQDETILIVGDAVNGINGLHLLNKS